VLQYDNTGQQGKAREFQITSQDYSVVWCCKLAAIDPAPRAEHLPSGHCVSDIHSVMLLKSVLTAPKSWFKSHRPVLFLLAASSLHSLSNPRHTHTLWLNPAATSASLASFCR